ncbi:MAG: hypothetical protein VKK62_06545, partial [Synechococcaceae cyanobacterium]|nr:hypothetical protein [Synechococcaceae cyanobacterium]
MLRCKHRTSGAGWPHAGLPRRRPITRRLAGPLALLLLAGAGLGCQAEAPFRRINGVWHYRDTAISGIESASFRPLDRHYAVDAKRAYYAHSVRRVEEFLLRRDLVEPLPGADVRTFAVLSHGYARDARRAWSDGTAFPVRDAAGLRVLDSVYVLDRRRVYYHQREIPGSDPASFLPLDDHYSRDGRAVYHGRVEPAEGRPAIQVAAIAGADPASFELLEEGYARDARQAYHDGRRLGRAAGLQVLGSGYARLDGR